MEEEKKQETTKKDSFKEIKKNVEEEINKIQQEKVKRENTDYLYRLVDIYKDLGEIEMQKEGINMRYKGQYGEYGEGSMGGYGEGSYGRRGVPGSGRGRYSEGSFGRRGVKGTGRGRYRGEEMMDEMMYHYGNYSEGSSYGAEGEAMESLSNLMESAYEYFKELKENANSQEEIKMMEHYFKKMGQM